MKLRKILAGMALATMLCVPACAFDSREELVTALRRAVKPGDVILFKGSHGMHLEKVLEAFLKEEK